MTVDEGWGGGDPRVRVAQLQLALLRKCRTSPESSYSPPGWILAQSEKTVHRLVLSSARRGA
jgi:hypothetical protein